MKTIYHKNIHVRNAISSEVCRIIAHIQKAYPSIWICPVDKNTIYAECANANALVFAEVALVGK